MTPPRAQELELVAERLISVSSPRTTRTNVLEDLALQRLLARSHHDRLNANSSGLSALNGVVEWSDPVFDLRQAGMLLFGASWRSTPRQKVVASVVERDLLPVDCRAISSIAYQTLLLQRRTASSDRDDDEEASPPYPLVLHAAVSFPASIDGLSNLRFQEHV